MEATKLRLSETHPLRLKFEELCAKAEELGITLSQLRDGMMVSDGQMSVLVCDLEDPENNRLTDFPPGFEFKLIVLKE
jgi:hypothetical protein